MKKYQTPVAVPKEIDAYWHERWAAVMNEHHRETFRNASVGGCTFTERAPDAPNGAGGYHFGFRPDGTFEFRDEEGDAVVEWDSYEFAYRALADESYDVSQALAEGRCRYTKNPESFGRLIEIVSAFRSSLKVAIADAEKKFGVELPKYW